MSGLLKKRSREEEEVLQNSPKRFNGRNEQQNFQSWKDFEFFEKIQSEEPAITSLAEEETGVFLFSGDYVTSRCENKESENGIDLSYLLEASNDELGLPASPFVHIDGQNVCAASSSDEDGFCTSCSHSAENAELKGFLDNWHFEDDFVDYTQFAVSDDSVASAWDVLNLEAFIDGDYSASWELETIC